MSFSIPIPSFVQITRHNGFKPDARVEGTFNIKDVGDFDFVIAAYGVPGGQQCCQGQFVVISRGDKTVLSFFTCRAPEDQVEKASLPIAKAFLVALRAAEGKITGIGENEPVEFPLPPELCSVSGMMG